MLPATNENAHVLIKRCFERIQAHECTAALPLRIVAKTFQPRGDLSLNKVQLQLDQMLQEALRDAPGVFYCAEEGHESSGPGMMYTDQ